LKYKFISFLLIIIILFSGCNKKSLETKDPIESIKYNLKNLKSYTATANVEIFNNKVDTKFSVRQFYKDGKYRIENLDNEGRVRQIIVFDGKRSYIYFSKVNQTYVEEDSNGGLLYSLITTFAKNYFDFGEISKNVTKDSYLILVPMQGENPLMYKEEMEFSKEDLKPLLLKIYSIDNNVVIKVKYENVIFNPQLNDEIFTKDNIKTDAANIKDNYIYSVDIKDVYKFSGINPLLPTYMVKGFKLANVSVDPAQNNSINIIYSKSDKILSIFESVDDLKYDKLEKRKSGNIEYFIYNNAYFIQRNGLKIELRADKSIPEEDVLKILDSFK